MYIVYWYKIIILLKIRQKINWIIELFKKYSIFSGRVIYKWAVNDVESSLLYSLLLKKDAKSAVFYN